MQQSLCWLIIGETSFDFTFHERCQLFLGFFSMCSFAWRSRRFFSTTPIDCCTISSYTNTFIRCITRSLLQWRLLPCNRNQSERLNKFFKIFLTLRYSSPVENLLSNVAPVVMAFPFLQSHVLTALLWISIAIITTLNDHSGHHLPFLHSSEIHDYHHVTCGFVHLLNCSLIDRLKLKCFLLDSTKISQSTALWT